MVLMVLQKPERLTGDASIQRMLPCKKSSALCCRVAGSSIRITVIVIAINGKARFPTRTPGTDE